MAAASTASIALRASGAAVGRLRLRVRGNGLACGEGGGGLRHQGEGKQQSHNDRLDFHFDFPRSFAKSRERDGFTAEMEKWKKGVNLRLEV
jgi:hypothetical protein